MIKIAPSILSADFMQLGNEVSSIELNGADYLHFDVMDGVFVNNISFGLPVLKDSRKAVNIPFDVHLMIVNPLKYVRRFCDDGADIVTFHYEAAGRDEIDKCISVIKNCGKKVGIAIKPGTNPEVLSDYITDLDQILVMTVEPGFGGQSFMMQQLDVIRKVKENIYISGSKADIEVDGGINAETAALAFESGANIFVAGSYIYGAVDRAAAINSLKLQR